MAWDALERDRRGMMRRQLALVLVAVLPTAVMADQEAAAAEPAKAAPSSKRELDGHVFAPSLFVIPPFRETTFQLGLLYGVGNATGPTYDSSGNVTGTQDLSLAALAQTFNYEYRFLEWLSAGVTAVTLAYTGITGASVVSIGAQVGIGLGAEVKLGHRFGPVETALLLDVSYAPQYGFLIADAILRALRDHVLDPAAALETTHSLTLSPTLAAAWAPFPALGLTGNLGYVFKSVRLSGTDILEQSAILIGVEADFDFGKISSTPIGLLASYRLSNPVAGDFPRVQDISGGISYTGRPELGLGLEIGSRRYYVRPGLLATATVAQIGLQYYW